MNYYCTQTTCSLVNVLFCKSFSKVQVQMMSVPNSYLWYFQINTYLEIQLIYIMNYVIIVYFIEQITYNSDFTGDLLLKPFSGKSRKTFKYEYQFYTWVHLDQGVLNSSLRKPFPSLSGGWVRVTTLNIAISVE